MGFFFFLKKKYAVMTELADVQDLGSCAFRRVGSSPTNRRKIHSSKMTKIRF